MEHGADKIRINPGNIGSRERVKAVEVGNDKFDWKLVGYGLPAMLFSVLCFLPRFIMTLVGKSYVLCNQSPIEWCDLGAAVFICALLLTRLTFGEKDTQTAAADENTES